MGGCQVSSGQISVLFACQVRSHGRVFQDLTGPPNISTQVGRAEALNLFQFCLLLNLSEMSDFEDDMDVDGPPPNHSIQFSSDNTTAKGKRIVADLPVEAEDNLPWHVLSESLQ
jgi:hypothetical protein